MTRLAAALTLLAGPALAGQTEGKPWTICIPVDAAMAAAWAAAHPSDPFPLHRRDYAPLRDTDAAWQAARDAGRAGWIVGGGASGGSSGGSRPTPGPIPPVPAPAALWLMLSAFAVLLSWRIFR